MVKRNHALGIVMLEPSDDVARAGLKPAPTGRRRPRIPKVVRCLLEWVE